MVLTRRDALLAAGALSLGLSGCLSESTNAAARAYDRAIGSYERGPRRGQADPLTLDEPVVVDDPDLVLVPEKNAVRFPSLMNESGVVAYDTIPFDRWAQLQCAEAGVDAVWDVVGERLGSDTDGISRGLTSSFPGMVIELALTTTLDREGNVESEPTVTFEQTLDVTPKSATATVSLDGREAMHTVPVQVVTGTVQYLSSGDGITLDDEKVTAEADD